MERKRRLRGFQRPDSISRKIATDLFDDGGTRLRALVRGSASLPAVRAISLSTYERARQKEIRKPRGSIGRDCRQCFRLLIYEALAELAQVRLDGP
jgi:hypothetical protein